MKKYSPLKGKPLRQAGQSLEEQIDQLINEKAMPFLIIPILATVFAGYEWYRFYFDTQFHPITFTMLALMSIIICIPQIIKFKKQLASLKLGRDGEKAVGQYLEQLRQNGCSVFHDIIGDNFNIDHVIISEKGIFLIETKTYSKPNTVNARVKYDKQTLLIDGLGDMSKILNQVKAASIWLKRMLEESTGKTYLIKPVILFPGWFVESPNDAEIWVLEPKQFPHYLNKKQELLSKEDKKLAAYHLSRYIRAL